MKPKKITCENCQGTGKEIYSCCGDELQETIYEDIGLCPTCKEHTGGECSECNGSGKKDFKPTFEVKVELYNGKNFEIKTHRVLAENEKKAEDWAIKNALRKNKNVLLGASSVKRMN